MLGRQKPAAVHADATQRNAAAGEHDKARKIAILAAQPVVDPRSGVRETEERLPGVDDVVALGMFVACTRHRPDQTKIVGARPHVREEFAHRHAALAVVFEAPRAGHDTFHVVKHRGLNGHGHGFARVARQARLRIEGVDV